MDEKNEKEEPSTKGESDRTPPNDNVQSATATQDKKENGAKDEKKDKGGKERDKQDTAEETQERDKQETVVETQIRKRSDEQAKEDKTEERTSGKEKQVLLVDEKDAEPGEFFTVDDVVNEAGYGKFQKFLTFLAGLGWLADAFEVIILSIIGDMLACIWPMKRWQNALLTSIVFFGMTIGAPTFGNFADRYGRRTALAISMLLLFIFGAASAASPNYTWIVVLRGLMGFSLGGIAQGVTLCCEYYPASVRGKAGFYLSYYWALGTIGVIFTAWIVMMLTNNWRIFVFLAAVPALVVFLTMKWYPESARYYLVSDQPEKAKKVLERLVRMNKAEMPRGRLSEVDALQQRGKIADLLKPRMRRTTLLFWYMWLAIACAYYGIALITPIIIKDGNLLASKDQHQNVSLWEDFTADMQCVNYTNDNFINLLWTSAAEFPGLLVFTIIVEWYSRKAILGTSTLLMAFFMLVLMLQIKPQIAMFLALFICRGLAAAVFQLLFIMTTEAFPTTLRASAMGTGSGCARFGGLLIPLLAQVTVVARPIPSMCVLSAITALAGIAAYLLPVDTRGRYMREIID